MKSVDEFELIKKIRKMVRRGPRVKRGIGDDTAVLCGTRKDVLFTTDMLVENVHFRLREASPERIGRKALAVNLSDIAAMGGLPTTAVVSVGLPKKCQGDFARRLFKGMKRLADECAVEIVGGDTNRSERLVINVAMLGEVEKDRAVLRSGARVGDHVFVSGPLGGSYASGKHLDFIPKIKEARALAAKFRVHAMMDISDGLASDLWRMAEESRVGFLIEEALVPVSRHAKGVRAALNDGEDFELLFTLAPTEAKRLPKRFVRIGRVVRPGDGIRLLRRDGRTSPLKGGFRHFR